MDPEAYHEFKPDDKKPLHCAVCWHHKAWWQHNADGENCDGTPIGAMSEEEKQEYRLDQQDEAERETEDDSLQGCCESDRIAEGLDAMGNPIDETIDITPVGCQTPEDERIRRAIEIIDRANSRVASLATEMVETHAKNEQYPCEKLDALKNAIQHRHKAYDSLYKAISGS